MVTTADGGGVRQLSGLDAAFVNLESPRVPMHLTSLLVYDQSTAPGGLVTFKQILDNVARRLPSVPQYRQRLVKVPFDLGYPWWVDDDHFDIEYHIRHLALPKPGDWRQLCIQVARLASRPLDMARPLWEITVVEGLDNVDGFAPGCFGLVVKTHHSAVDGASGMQILSVLQDLTPEPELPPVEPWEPAPAPTGIELLSRGMVSSMIQPMKTLRHAAASLPALGRVAGGLTAGELTLPTKLGRAPTTRFSGAVTPHRIFDGIAIDLADLKRIRRGVDGATINDVVLSIVGGALRDYLLTVAELPEQGLQAMAPISVRGSSAEQGNLVSAMVAPLCTDIADPLERLAAVHAGTVASKALTEAVGARLLTEYAIDAPAAIASLGTRLAMRANLTNQSRRLFNTVVTNVPGPQVPTYFCGARLRAHYGLGPLQDGVGIFHSLMSADGRVFLSVTSCRGMLDDPAAYAAAMRASLDAALAAAG